MIKNLLENPNNKIELVMPLDYYQKLFCYIVPEFYRVNKEDDKRKYIYIQLSKAELNTNTKIVNMEYKGTNKANGEPGNCTLNFSIESIFTMLINKENPDTDNLLFYGYSDDDKIGFYMDLLKELINKL